MYTGLQASNCLILSLTLISLRDNRRYAAACCTVTMHCHVVVSFVGNGFELSEEIFLFE